jgi:hypothetical protein
MSTTNSSTTTTVALTTDAGAEISSAIDDCVETPDLLLASGDQQVAMDLVYFGGCDLNSDGVAMFDNAFRPSEALLIENEVELLNAGDAEVTYGVTALTPDLRLAGLKPDSTPDIRGSHIVLPILVNGCSAVVVGWTTARQAGQFVAIVEAAAEGCTSS